MNPAKQPVIHLLPSKTLAACAAALLAPALHAEPMFGPATPVAEFNTFNSEQLTDLSPDGLTAILQSNRDDINGWSRIYSSTRPTLSDPWSVPSNTDFAATNSLSTNVGHGILSADGLSLFYQHNPHIRLATRATPFVPFPAGTAVTPLNIGTYERPGKLSADGLRMYLEIFSGGNVDFYVSDRPTISDPWSTPAQGPFAANINTTFAEVEPFLTTDELQLFYGSNRTDGLGGIDIWWADRASVSDPFSVPVNLASVNTLGSDRSPELFGDTLFFTSDRNFSFDVFSAVAVPEPGSLALLLAGSVGALVRRRRK